MSMECWVDDYDEPDPFEDAPAKVKARERDRATKVEAFYVISGGRQPECVDCGDVRSEVLHVEHKNNDGKAHRKALGKGGNGAGMRTWRWAIANPKAARESLELVCANCHCIRTSERHIKPEHRDWYIDDWME